MIAKDKITKAKIALMRDTNTSFFSYLLSLFKITEDEDIGTMAVSPEMEIIYSPSFVDKYNSQQAVFCLCHETMHYALMHLIRIPNGNKRRAGVAFDLKVNDILVEEGIGEVINEGLIPKNHEYKLPNGYVVRDINLKSCEDIYKELEDNDEEKDDDNSDDTGGSGNGLDSFDEHMYKPMNQKEAREVQRHIASAVYAQQRGFKSADLQRVWKDIHEPYVDWRILLRRFVQPHMNDSYSWRRLNKKTLSQRILLPGYVKSEKINGVLAVDTSGSMTDDMLSDVVSEIKGLINSFASLSIKLLIGDSELKEEYDIDKNFDINMIKMKGGGGTSHKYLYDYLEHSKVDFAIGFTDGYSDIESIHREYTHMIWLVPENCKDLSQYGEQVWMKKE